MFSGKNRPASVNPPSGTTRVMLMPIGENTRTVSLMTACRYGHSEASLIVVMFGLKDLVLTPPISRRSFSKDCGFLHRKYTAALKDIPGDSPPASKLDIM